MLIDNRPSAPFDFSTERDLNVIGDSRSGRRKCEVRAAAPFRNFKIGLSQTCPELANISTFLGELGHYPGAQLTHARAVRPDN